MIIKNKKPEWKDEERLVEDILEWYDCGTLLYWFAVQRRYGAWSNSSKINYIVNKINGIRVGTNITVCDMDGHVKWNKRQENWTDMATFENAIKNMVEYRRGDPNLQHLTEEYLEDTTGIFGLIEGMHRTTTLWEFHNNMFALPKGTILYLKSGGTLCLAKEMKFDDLPDDYQREFLKATVPVTIMNHGKYEHVQYMVTSINSNEPWGRAEKRKLFAHSIVSEFIFELECKYWDIIVERCAKKFWEEGKAMTFMSRILSWENLGIDKKTSDEDLDELHRTHTRSAGSSKIEQKHYNSLEQICKDVFTILNLEDQPYLESAKKCYSVDALYTLALACKALKNTSMTNHYPLTISNHGKWAKKVLEFNKHLELTVMPCREDYPDYGALDWNHKLKTDSYENWRTWATATDVKRRYEALCQHIGTQVGELIEDGTLKVVRTAKATFTDEQKRQARKAQNNIDPISSEPLMSNAEAHHKTSVAKNGATTKENLAMLNPNTHSLLTNDSEFKDWSWKMVMDNVEEVRDRL